MSNAEKDDQTKIIKKLKGANNVKNFQSCGENKKITKPVTTN
jgi:hypothetical protein